MFPKGVGTGPKARRWFSLVIYYRLVHLFRLESQISQYWRGSQGRIRSANKPGPSTLPLRSRPAAVASSLKLTVVTGCRWGVGEGRNHPGTSLQLSGLRPACILLTYQLLRSDMSISTVASVGEHNLTSDRCNVDWQNHSHVPRTCHVSCLHSQLWEHHLLPVFPYVTYS